MNRLFVLLFGAASLVAHAQVPDYVPTEGLVAWYPFNGNANDESGNGFDATPTNVELTADRSDIIESAFQFDYNQYSNGSLGDMVWVSHQSEFNTPELTVSVWFKQTDYSYSGNPGSQAIIKRVETGYSNPPGEFWSITMDDEGTIGGAIFNSTVLNASSAVGFISINEWYHAVLTYDTEVLRLYVNGESIAEDSGADLLRTEGVSGVSIGVSNQANGYWRPFHGVIDDAAMWNRALTEEEILGLYNAPAPAPGCTDPTACNYDAEATDSAACIYVDGICETCSGETDGTGTIVDNDADDDGVCDNDGEVTGCTEATACNYDAEATDDDGMCEYAEEYFDCYGYCLNDADGDFVCDELEVAGCTDEMACNYDVEATDDDGMCEYMEEYYDCDGYCLYDSDGDFVCDELEVAGCTDEMACNYDVEATDDDGMCEYAVEYFDCDGVCLNDGDMDGVCDELEVAGCTDELACNYNLNATDDDGSCDYLSCIGCTDDVACNYDSNALYEDGSCDYSCLGCMDETACNFDAEATSDDGSCISAGCTNEAACNFNPDAGCDDESCAFDEDLLDCDAFGFESDSLVVCFGAEVELTAPIDNSTGAPSGTAEFIDEFYLDFGGPSSHTLGDQPSGSYQISVSGTWCGGSCWNGHTSDAAYSFNHPYGNGVAPLGGNSFTINEYCPQDDNSCELIRPEPDQYNLDHIYTYIFEHPGGELMFYGLADECCWWDNQAGLSFSVSLLPISPCVLDYAWNNGANEASIVVEPQSSDFLAVTVSNSTEQCTDSLWIEVVNQGCSDADACNFNPSDLCTVDCIFPVLGAVDCEQGAETCGEGTIWNSETQTCVPEPVNPTASDISCGEGTLWSPTLQQCIPDPMCLGDLNGDGIVGTSDLLSLLSLFGLNCSVTGCVLPFASNYNVEASEDDWSCIIEGCADENALNYVPSVNTPDNSLCIYNTTESTGACLGLNTLEYFGYYYPLVEIGSTCWFKENLQTSYFSDSTSIALADVNGNWSGEPYPASTYGGGSELTAMTFGLLYNWHAKSDSRGICPVGWNPADSSAWNEAIELAGGASVGAPAMRVPGNQITGDGIWEMNNDNSTNATGFSALPAGYRLPNGNFGGVYATGQFWGGESISTGNARSYYLNQSLDLIGITQNNKSVGLAIRCVSQPVFGCTEPGACNFNPEADQDDGSCELGEYFVEDCICWFACGDDEPIEDITGPCSWLEISGCTDPTACNFNADVCDDDGSCSYATDGCDCGGGCCCPGDCNYPDCLEDGDGVCGCDEIAGCQDEAACNYDADATDEDGSCTYAEENYDCDGNCLNDADGDYVCDENEVEGCINPNACNYVDPSLVTDLVACVFPEEGYDCDGNCLNDADGDGVCNEFSVVGCQDAWACNFNADATDDDASCVYAEGCETCSGATDGTGTVVDNDADDDGVCDAAEIVGCQSSEACNYNVAATDPGACLFVDGICETCSGETDGTGTVVDNDADDDGVCDADEISGCTDPSALNYNPNATDDSGGCQYE